MNGFVKKSTFIAIVLLSASVAYAGGELRPAGGGIHQAPQTKQMGIDKATANAAHGSAAADAVSKVHESRRLRPAPAKK